MEKVKRERLLRLGSPYEEYKVLEITGLGTQELIAGKAGLNIILRNWEGIVGSATTLYLSYATNKVSPKYDLASKGSFERKFRDSAIILPAGEGLDVVTSADPDEGWIALEYEFIDYKQPDNTVY